MSKTIPSLLLLSFIACTSAPPPAPPAPWRGVRLRSPPPVYLTEWRNAENRATCAPLAFAALGTGEGATPRRANFGGGWGVAYDTVEMRSAFGIAGTGLSGTEPDTYRWPHRRSWSDGSSAGYGPEGGTGTNQLAYLRVSGQDCLYNVWSRLGRDHLQYLLEQLRFVDVDQP